MGAKLQSHLENELYEGIKFHSITVAAVTNEKREKKLKAKKAIYKIAKRLRETPMHTNENTQGLIIF